MTSPSAKASVEIRKEILDTLRLDLVGPDNDHAFARELLPESPIRWYLTGLLAPTTAPLSQRFDETSVEEIDTVAVPDGIDDSSTPDRAASAKGRRSLLASSMGLSILVPANARKLRTTIEWGDYIWESPDGGEEPAPSEAGQDEAAGEAGGESAGASKAKAGESGGASLRGYRRTPRTEQAEITLPESNGRPLKLEVPNGNGLQLVVTIRPAQTTGLPAGTRSVSVFLVNARPADEERAYRAFIFQARLTLHSDDGFIPRPDPRGSNVEDDWDQRVADLQYRDLEEYAVGHGVAPSAEVVDGRCGTVRTVWIPATEVERVEAAQIPDVELGMEALGDIADGADASKKLSPLVSQYRSWIKAQGDKAGSLNKERAKTAKDMLIDAEKVARRIEDGIALLTDPDALEAFRIANRAVARAFRQREARTTDHHDPARIDAPRWRPFQLAYLLMTIRGIANPAHADRANVDLLFFPTGGGKTEAYLALSAFTLVLRRLRSKGADGKPTIRSSGVSVLMRYTLRLLTLDQLGRAAGLICALELERQKAPEKLGAWPFEIGLWVGQAATPNRLGGQGQPDPYGTTAYAKTRKFKSNPDSNPSPIPIEECPWCGTKFTAHSFRLIPNDKSPTDLQVHCTNFRCDFRGDRALPIVAVDEPIYRRLPCFMIATVDKFAALPWTGHTGALFGKVNRCDDRGFYGPCDAGKGMAIPGGELPPPDLIIQDELHLISGPLGTIAGLYETVIDELSSRKDRETVIRPKIIASTATVRRADSQIRALFGRRMVTVFPSPGPDRKDSFFSRTISATDSPARLYVGVAAQGKSLKVLLLRASLALLSAGQTAWEAGGGKRAEKNAADPYMTLLSYFNSLRELGGSRRIFEDEVGTRLREYGRRRRRDPEDRLFRKREISYDPLELTSRVQTNDVAVAKRRLALSFKEDEHVDVALATNMISVGLDIGRLGLMVVLGQPKGSSEYIQATSRVGRIPDRPGLIVTLLNIHKPRDRSHYERFSTYHSSFYRSVEATSVTPFSPRAMDRALAATLAALCRLGDPAMTPPGGAHEIVSKRNELEAMIAVIAERARNHKEMSDAEQKELYAVVLHRCGKLLDSWLKIAKKAEEEGSAIQYQRETPAPPRRLLYEYLHPDLPNLHPIQRQFRANRSMRDVEPSVEVFIKNLNDWSERHE